jgi:hypothetical protein
MRHLHTALTAQIANLIRSVRDIDTSLAKLGPVPADLAVEGGDPDIALRIIEERERLVASSRETLVQREKLMKTLGDVRAIMYELELNLPSVDSAEGSQHGLVSRETEPPAAPSQSLKLQILPSIAAASRNSPISRSSSSGNTGEKKAAGGHKPLRKNLSDMIASSSYAHAPPTTDLVVPENAQRYAAATFSSISRLSASASAPDELDLAAKVEMDELPNHAVANWAKGLRGDDEPPLPQLQRRVSSSRQSVFLKTQPLLSRESTDHSVESKTSEREGRRKVRKAPLPKF